MLRTDATRADIVVVSGFASIFLILGVAFLMFFSTGSSLSCDKRTDRCTLNYNYVLSETEVVQWTLSQTKYLFLEKKESSYSQDSSYDSSQKPVTHRYRVVFVLQDGSRIPFLQSFTGGTERQEKLKNGFQAYLQSTPTTPKYRNRFKQEYHDRFVPLGGGGAILVALGIFWYGLIRKN